jgi:hypothetical protein
MPGTNHSIQYITHNKIDKLKWDDCIAGASNSLIYATALYLDEMAKYWDALILNNYEAVMPLTYNKKLGIYYLYQPFACASLGVFGNHLSQQVVELFLQNIPPHFKYADIYLNRENNFNVKSVHLTPRTNYVLSLDKPYTEIDKQYRQSYQQILKNIGTATLIKINIDYELVIDLAQKKMNEVKPFKMDDIKRFRKLCHALLQKDQVKTYGVFHDDNLVASGIFFIDNCRAYYVMAGNTTPGRTLGASHILIDAFIKNHSDRKLSLDFEGSNIPGIAFFFKGFGAMKEIYFSLRFNRLNKLIQLFKK